MTSPLQAVTTEDGRYYPREGIDYVSVTTVLSALPKPFLVQWAAREVATYAMPLIEGTHFIDMDGNLRDVGSDATPLTGADLLKHLKREPIRQRDTAGSLGDEVHGHCETILTCNMDSATAREYADTIGDRKVRNRVLRFAQFLDDHDVEPMHIEATVYSDKHLYAGSCDIMALIDGVPTICDIKTSKSVHAEVALQLSAYANADYILSDAGEKTPLPRFERAAVLHLKDRSYSLIECELSERVFEAFTAILFVRRRWVDLLSKTALLDHINPKEVCA